MTPNKFLNAVIVCVLWCFYPRIIDASSDGWERLGGPEGGKIISISIKNNSVIAYSGNYGADHNFYRSTDMGKTWCEIGPKPRRDPNDCSIAIIDSIVIISSQSGTFRSENYGKSWSNLTISNTLSSRSTSLATAFGIFFSIQSPYDSILYRSIDYGVTWERIQITEYFDLNNTVIYGTTILIPSPQLINQSLDSGKTWKKVLPPLHDNESINSVTSIQQKIIVCTNRSIFITDNGSDWYRSNTGLPENPTLYGLKVSGNDIYTWFKDSLLFRSSDGGRSWNKLNHPGKVRYDKIAIENDLIFYNYPECTPEKGCQCLVSTSTDRGATWHTVQLKDNSCSRISVAILNGYLFCIEADGVYCSSDSGKTFIKSSHGIFDANIFVIAKAGNNLYTGTNMGMFKSLDNGINWTLQEIDSSQTPFYATYNIGKAGNHLYAYQPIGLFSLHCESSQWKKEYPKNTYLPIDYSPFIFAGSKSYFFRYVKHDSDTVWDLIDTTSMATLITDHTIDNSTQYISGFNGLYRSTDNGNTWKKVHFSPVYCLASYDNSLYAGLDSNLIIYSLDKGTSWKQIPEKPPLQQHLLNCSNIGKQSRPISIAAYKSFLFIAYQTSQFDCNPTNSFVSSDYGNSWQTLADKIPYIVNRFQIIDDELYATTQYGGLWRLHLSELPIVQKSVDSNVQTGDFLYLVSRNASREPYALHLKLTDCKRITAKLYSLTGKTIVTLVNGVYQSGTHTFRFGTHRFTQGCYILSLSVGQQIKNVPIQLIR